MARETGVPAGRRRIIERPRLLRMLDESDARIILLVAPAGYGKTTLARQWLSNTSRRMVPVLPPGESRDPVALAVALARAAKRIVPDAGSRLFPRLSFADAPSISPSEIIELLSEEFSQWPSDSWLLLEDLRAHTDNGPGSLLARLSERTSIRLLLTTRSRPTWATSRRRLYAEVFEVGASDLAFNYEETRALLPRQDHTAITELMRLTAGWPAVLGLAALADDPIPTIRDAPTALFDYFADELYKSVAPSLRTAARILATASNIDDALLMSVFGGRSELIARDLIASGFLQPTELQSFDLHPLLRAFLLGKSTMKEQRSAAVKIARYYLDVGAWDNAFVTIQSFQLPDLLEDLLSRGLDDCLTSGRVATVEAWVSAARSANLSAAVVDLAEAELAFRHGEHQLAAARYQSAATRLPSGTRRTAYAYFRLGQAHQFLSQIDKAHVAYRTAASKAIDRQGRRDALWGSFTLAYETGAATMSHYLEEYERTGSLGHDEVVQLATGQIALALRLGEGRRAGAYYGRALPKVAHASDPFIKTAFFNAAISLLLARASYSEALELSRRQIHQTAHSSLRLVTPHARLNQAASLVGLRRLTQARQLIKDLEADDQITSDTFADVNLSIVRAKLAVAEGDLDSAARVLALRSPTSTGTVLDSEVASMHSVVLAAKGSYSEARRVQALMNELPASYETQMHAAWSSALCDLGEGGNAQPCIPLYDEACHSTILDPLFFAVRAEPTLLGIFSTDRERLIRLRQLVIATRDEELMERLQALLHGVALLSPREIEVSRLLARGLTNREIAEQLHITEPTAKVHVRRVLAKLGVSSRTKAALLLASREPTLK